MGTLCVLIKGEFPCRDFVLVSARCLGLLLVSDHFFFYVKSVAWRFQDHLRVEF